MKKILTFYFAVLMLTSASLHSFAQSHNLVVISNPKGAPTEITHTELLAVMKGEKQRWNDGTRISIALMKSSTTTGEVTSEKIYGMSGDEVNKFWLALVFQGKAKAPVFFNSAADLETYISQTPGGIGVVDDTPEVKSKPMLVDGKKSL
ncbi:MAG: hypothetical protein ABI763_13465 [Bacteroidota bacterium]